MIEEVVPNIFRIDVPLPLPGVDSMNCYVITDSKRNLVVDPGMAHPMCEEVINNSLNKLGLDLEKTDFFITHHHFDHFSLVSTLLKRNSSIYINRTELEAGRKTATAEAVPDFIRLLDTIGFPEKDHNKLIPEFFTGNNRIRASLPYHYVKDGDEISKGGYRFRCVLTPGHSLCHTCLYEPEEKVLIAGDAISPVLQFLSPLSNPLGDHLTSLNQLKKMDVRLVLPGHQTIFSNARKRISKIESYHNKRLAAVSTALADGEKNAYQVAVNGIVSTVKQENIKNMSIIQKFFLARDCFAHLKYLENIGRVLRKSLGRVFHFHLEQPNDVS